MQARNSTKAQTWGYVNNGCFGATVSVKLCRTYYTGSGGACGATNTPPSLNSNFTLQMTPGTEWTGAAYPDSYYFYVTVGAGCSGVSNIVFGYDYETWGLDGIRQRLPVNALNDPLVGPSLGAGWFPESHRGSSIATWAPSDRVDTLCAQVVGRLAQTALEDLQIRYDVGRRLNEMRYTEWPNQRGVLYNHVATRLRLHVSAVRKYVRVAATVSPEEFASLIAMRTADGFPMTWSHIELLAETPRASRRRDLADRAVRDVLSVRALARLVRSSGNRGRHKRLAAGAGGIAAAHKP
jgi:hypothetical protein